MDSDFNELKERMMQTIFRMRQIIMSLHSREIVELNLNLVEITLLVAIKDNSLGSEKNIADLQKLLSVTKAAVSKMLGVLENKGYVIRDINKQNRRTLLITLTPKGKEAIEYIEKEIDENLIKIFERMGKDNIEQFITNINRYADTISDIYEEMKQSQEE